MRASRIMFLGYLCMVGVPVLLWVIAVTSPIQQAHSLRETLAVLAALGSILFGAIGVRDAYVRRGGRM